MKLHGAFFTGTTEVKFGTTDSPAFTVNSDIEIECTVPPGTGNVTIAVTNENGTGTYYPYHYPEILDVDFSKWTTGFYNATTLHAQSYYAPVKTDLTFVRNYAPGGTNYTTTNGAKGETVQASSSTLKASAATRQDNIACIGNRTDTGSKTGLVIQNSKWNFLGSAADNFVRDRTLWPTAGSSVTTTYPYADSPDGSGTGCSEEDVLSGGSGRSFSGIPAGAGGFSFTFSAWQKSVNAASNGEMWLGMINNTPGNTAHITVTPASNVWAPVSVYNQANGGTLQRTSDGQAWPSASTAQHRTTLTDYAQLEGGSWRSECIPTPQSVRPYDRLSYATGSALVASTGQLKFYARFTPKMASTQDVTFMQNIGAQGNQTKWTLWSYNADGNHYAYIDASTKKLHVRLGTTTGDVTSTNALAWSQYDEIEIYIAVGSNVASVAKYRVNGGAWTDLVLAIIADVPAPSGAFSFFFNDASGETGSSGPIAGTASLPCWLHRITFYHGTTAPDGV